LGAHADDAVPGIDIHTGSLGHGLSIGCGLAFAARMDRKKYLTFVLLGDGECHEGSIWESAMFAGHHKLTNLIAIVDNNRLSASDYLDKYLSLKPLSKKFGSFGWKAVQVDGHSIPQILNVLKGVHNRKERKPLAIIANTAKGKGISIIENRADWHYRVPVGKELEIARKELSLRLAFINK
jgi:transketolase